MDNLRKLREANPHIRIHTVHEAAFRRYGSVIQEDTSALCAAAETLPFPEEGSKYVASTPELDEIPGIGPKRKQELLRGCGKPTAAVWTSRSACAGDIPISSTRWNGIPAMNSTSRSGSWFCCWRSGRIWTRMAG